jgi:hypothetical protein
MECPLIFKQILESMNVSFDSEGLASLNVNDSLQPLTVNGKRLVLPLPEVLSSRDWNSTKIAFAPLGENILRGESEIIVAYRGYIKVALTNRIALLWYKLLQIAADTDSHKRMKPAQQVFLGRAMHAREKTLHNLRDILNKVELKGSNQLFNIWLRRGYTFDGQTYKRAAVVDFPVVKEFANDKEIFGIKCSSENDFKTIVEIFQYMFPFSEETDGYTVGSDNDYAPYFHALTKAYVKIAKRINEIVDLLREHIDNVEEIYTDLSWDGFLHEFKKYHNEIPVLPGNEGAVAAGQTKPTLNIGGDILDVSSRSSAPVSEYDMPVEDRRPQQQPQQQVVDKPQGGKVTSWANRSREQQRQEHYNNGYPPQPYPQQPHPYYEPPPPQPYGYDPRYDNGPRPYDPRSQHRTFPTTQPNRPQLSRRQQSNMMRRHPPR